MRASTLLDRVLNLDGVTVTDVHPGSVLGDGPVVVRLAPATPIDGLPSCSYRTRHRYDSGRSIPGGGTLTWADGSASW